MKAIHITLEEGAKPKVEMNCILGNAELRGIIRQLFLSSRIAKRKAREIIQEIIEEGESQENQTVSVSDTEDQGEKEKQDD